MRKKPLSHIAECLPRKYIAVPCKYRFNSVKPSILFKVENTGGKAQKSLIKTFQKHEVKKSDLPNYNRRGLRNIVTQFL